MAANHSRARRSSKSETTCTSRRKDVKNCPAAMSQSPSSQARFCQPVSPSSTFVYSGSFYRLGTHATYQIQDEGNFQVLCHACGPIKKIGSFPAPLSASIKSSTTLPAYTH